MDNPLILIAVIAVVIVAAIFLPRWIRSSTKAAGGRTGRRYASAERERILGELGTTIVIHAPARVAREIVDAVARQQPRKFTVLPDGGYGIRFLEEDDAIAHLIDGPDGIRLQVDQAREYLGMPKGSAFWKDFRSRVASAAGAREVSIIEGPRNRYVRVDGEPAMWTSAEDGA